MVMIYLLICYSNHLNDVISQYDVNYSNGMIGSFLQQTRVHSVTIQFYCTIRFLIVIDTVILYFITSQL